MDLYHNIEQNKRVPFISDVLDTIIEEGFKANFDEAVWLSDKPVGDGTGLFSGLVVHVPSDVDLESYRVYGDGIEDLGVCVYAIPAECINQYEREICYPEPQEIIE